MSQRIHVSMKLHESAGRKPRRKRRFPRRLLWLPFLLLLAAGGYFAVQRYGIPRLLLAGASKTQPAPVIPPFDSSAIGPLEWSDAIGADSSHVLYGLDLSKWDGNVIYEIPSRDSIHFLICKATEGIEEVDDKYALNMSLMHLHRYLSGAYHFYDSDKDPVQQAEHFWSVVSRHERPDITPVLDVEEESIPRGRDVAPDKLQRDVRAFLERLEQLSGRVPMIYCDPSFADKYFDDPSFARYPLWLADYTRGQPRVPRAWRSTGFKIWQRSESYRVFSVLADFDVYNGTVSELLK